MSATALPGNASAHSQPPAALRRRRRVVLILPAALFAALAIAFAASLDRDASVLPSALIGRSVPVFDLPPVQGRRLGLSSADLKGRASLVNVFASWCAACREEHPLFMALAKEGAVPIHGLNHKDRPENAAAWLDGLGDPYERTGADLDGRVAIDWGVYGVPETFVVSAAGTVLYRHVGPVNEQALREVILPLLGGAER